MPISPPEAVFLRATIVLFVASYGEIDCFIAYRGDGICSPQSVVVHAPRKFTRRQNRRAARAVETFAMQRLTQLRTPQNLICGSSGFAKLILSLCFAASLGITANAQSVGSGVVQADYEASGFVTPAGMVPPEQAFGPGGIMQVGFTACDSCGSGGCDGGCSSGGCDSVPTMGGCTGGCGANPATGGCGGSRCSGGGIFGSNDGGHGSGSASGGIFGGNGGGGCGGGKGCGGGLFGGNGCGGGLFGGGGCKCGLGGGGGCDLSNMCIWCRGQGCSACQLGQNGNGLVSGMLGLLGALRPYQQASLCNTRWYDISAEAVFLTHDLGAGGAPNGITSDGLAGPTVLGVRDNNVSLEGGVRVSGALIFGPGSNLELTYMGGQEWQDTVGVTSTTPTLFSFISDFGTSPFDGFDDPDRSLSHTVAHRSEFHTAEINYRRRTMWPYCRFQGSWLIGLRYLRYDDSLVFSATGTDNNTGSFNGLRFYQSSDSFRNSLFGPQAGFDFWWNIRPAVSLGIAAKGAWVLNDIDRTTNLTANSIGTGATQGTQLLTDGLDDVSVLGEVSLQLAWRISHSWTIRSAYYGIGVDDIAFGSVDRETNRDFVFQQAPQDAVVNFDDLFVHGFSLGAEYQW